MFQPQANAFERHWLGTGSVWDAGTANWTNGDTAGVFQPGNAAVFDDTGAANATITLSGAMQPSGIMVSGTTNYIFTGSGTIAAASLVKSGTGTLTLGGGHSFGSVFVQGGALALTGGTFRVSGAMTNSATVRLTGGAALNVSGTFVNNGLLDLMTGAQTLPLNFINYGTVLDASLIRMNAAAKDGATLTLTIVGYAGHNYQLLRADNLTSPWTGIGGAQAGNGSLLTLSDAGGAVGEQKFYRVMVAP